MQSDLCTPQKDVIIYLETEKNTTTSNGVGVWTKTETFVCFNITKYWTTLNLFRPADMLICDINNLVSQNQLSSFYLWFILYDFEELLRSLASEKSNVFARIRFAAHILYEWMNECHVSVYRRHSYSGEWFNTIDQLVIIEYKLL